MSNGDEDVIFESLVNLDAVLTHNGRVSDAMPLNERVERKISDRTAVPEPLQTWNCSIVPSRSGASVSTVWWSRRNIRVLTMNLRSSPSKCVAMAVISASGSPDM